jgi:hypothetical protein
MDFVLAQFEEGKEAHVDDLIMAPMYNSGWANIYYKYNGVDLNNIAITIYKNGL